MSYHSIRGLSGLVSPRSWLPSLLALGGLLLAPAARAQEEEGPIATITDMVPAEGGLRVRILWSEKQPIPDSAKLVSYDGRDSVNDSAELTPKAGEETEVLLGGALMEPWETGWSQLLVLEDAKGEVLVTQPYNVNLDCGEKGDEDCTLTVSAGPGSSPDVVQLSEELDDFITKLEASKPDEEFDLIDEVMASHPRLLGEALVYSHRMNRLTFSGPCKCKWKTVVSKTPANLGYAINFTAPSGTLAGWNGPGAKHGLTATGGNASGLSHFLTGSSQVSLKLKCERRVYYYFKDIVLDWPRGQRSVLPIPLTRIVPCTSTCAVRFDHQGSIGGATFVVDTSPGSVTAAKEMSSYLVNGTSVMNLSASQGTSFYQPDDTTVWSNLGSTARVNSTAFVRAVSAFPYFGSASVSNSQTLAIHAKTNCPQGPEGHGAVFTYGTSQVSQTSPTSPSRLREYIRRFFWERGHYIFIP